MSIYNFQNLLKSEGLQCSNCTKTYELEPLCDQNQKFNLRVPAALSGCIHAVCIECFRQMEQLSCPICHKQFEKKYEVLHEVTKVQYNTYKRCFEIFMPQVATHPSKEVETIPPVWSVLTSVLDKIPALERVELAKNKLLASLPALMKAFKWDHCDSILKGKVQEWICVSNANNQTIGLAWNHLRYDHLWEFRKIGITDPTLLEKMMSALIAHAWNTPQHRHPKVLSFYFLLPSELHIYERVITMMRASKLHYALCKSDDEAWVNLYYNFQNTFSSNEMRILDFAYEKKKDLGSRVPMLKSINATTQISTLFEKHANASTINFDLLKSDFLNHPEQFFIYLIDWKAASYFQITIGKISQRSATIAGGFIDHDKSYESHFIKQFLEWIFCEKKFYNLCCSTIDLAPELQSKLRDIAIKNNYRIIEAPPQTKSFLIKKNSAALPN